VRWKCVLGECNGIVGRLCKEGRDVRNKAAYRPWLLPALDGSACCCRADPLRGSDAPGNDNGEPSEQLFAQPSLRQHRSRGLRTKLAYAWVWLRMHRNLNCTPGLLKGPERVGITTPRPCIACCSTVLASLQHNELGDWVKRLIDNLQLRKGGLQKLRLLCALRSLT
jgi:hypothetical protein